MIYFIRAGKTVKIGVSDNPNLRLRELQTGNPFRLKLLGVMAGEYMVEKELHSLFERFRLEGEWFRFTGELEACVLSLTDPGRKHTQVTTVKQLLENGMHLQVRQKMNRNLNYRKKVHKVFEVV